MTPAPTDDPSAVVQGPPPPPPLSRERRLTIVLRPPGDDAPGHTGGVGALLVAPSTSDGQAAATSLFSGSRDASVRAWSIGRSGARNSAPTSLTPAACWRGHGGWVNALACPAPGLIASGSADRTVKLWRADGPDEDGCGGVGVGVGGVGGGGGATPGDASPLVATLSAHADYVTCLAASPTGAPGRLASAGLGTQVLLWDVGAATAVGSVRVGADEAGGGGGGCGGGAPPLPPDPRTTPWRPPALEAAAARASVYALAMDGAGVTIAAGGPAGALRLADARTGAPAAALRGHAPDSVVRAALLSADGRRALSGGSDRSVRLWDVGTRRCIAVLAVHTDSVWALAAAAEGGGGGGGGRRAPPPASPAAAWGDAFLSGGRDGRVYWTDARARSACLVCEDDEPVTALALDPGGGLVWAGRERAAGVEGWAVPPPPPAPAARAPPSPAGCVASPSAAAAAAAAGGARPVSLPPGGAFPVSASPLVRGRQVFVSAGAPPGSAAAQPRSAPPPASAAPALAAPGAGPPPIVAATVLPDRRRVLTQALDGAVDEWDVAAGRVVARRAPPGSPAGAALAAAARAAWAPASVPPWFSADCSSGRLGLVLAPPACFGAEVYAAEVGWAAAPDDLKVNCGQELLRAALGGWAAAAAAAQQAAEKGEEGEEGGGGGGGGEAAPAEAGASPVYFRLAGAAAAAAAAAAPRATGAPAAAPAPAADGPPGPPPATPPALVVGEGGDPVGLPWVVAASAFTGAEPSPGLVPGWAADAVLRGRLAGDRRAGREAKVAFVLAPSAGSGLPGLTPPRLSAPRVLPLRKVAAYAVAKLAEAGVECAPLGAFWDGRAQAAADAAAGAEDAAAAAAGRPPRARLELTIAGCAALHDLSLAAARAHLWRGRGDDLPIAYRLVRAGEPRAPRPVIRPPRE